MIMKKLNRREAIRNRCIDCSGFAKMEVRNCAIFNCQLWPFRMATGKQNAKARDKAIRDYCLECMEGQSLEVRLCPSVECSLYPYRQTANTMRKKRHIGETYWDKIPTEGVR